jgi:hypothetical protein
MPAKKLYDLPVEVLADIVARVMEFDPSSNLQADIHGSPFR